jgi:hypothetical protein
VTTHPPACPAHPPLASDGSSWTAAPCTQHSMTHSTHMHWNTQIARSQVNCVIMRCHCAGARHTTGPSHPAQLLATARSLIAPKHTTRGPYNVAMRSGS